MPLVRRAHPLEEIRERVPVVEHEVAHAQERELLQAPRPRVVPKRALRDAVEREVVVPLQCVFPRQRHAVRDCRFDDLLQQPCM